MQAAQFREQFVDGDQGHVLEAVPTTGVLDRENCAWPDWQLGSIDPAIEAPLPFPLFLPHCLMMLGVVPSIEGQDGERHDHRRDDAVG